MSIKAPVIAVLGAGSWGTALALQLDRSGTRCILWGRNAEHLMQLGNNHCNQRYLPGITIPSSIKLETDLQAAVQAAEHVLLATPSHVFAEVIEAIKDGMVIPGK